MVSQHLVTDGHCSTPLALVDGAPGGGGRGGRHRPGLDIDSRGIHQDVERPELLLLPGEELGDAVAAGDVHLVVHDRRLADVARGVLFEDASAAAGNGHAASFGRQGLGDAPADASAAAGD